MAKFDGYIGYAETVETRPGVWEEQITEHFYYGDWVRNTRKLQSSGNVNDNVNISNELSIVSDPYAINNFFNIRYIVFMGAKWKVESADIKYPRLILTIGGLYNGKKA